MIGCRAMARNILPLALCVAIAACDDKPPSPPSVPPGAPSTINGSERLGWNQAAADAVEIATFRYAIYTDGSRSELSGASCTRAGGAGDFSCSGPVPSMSPGAHTLELATFIVNNGTVLESARSSPLEVTFSPSVTATAVPSESEAQAGERSRLSRRPPAGAAWPSAVVTNDGVRLQLHRIATDVAEPTDLAFAPDGRLFIAERAGTIRVVVRGRLAAEPALTRWDRDSVDGDLLALALDPRFEQTRFLYAIFTAAVGSGRLFHLARFRETANTLADRVILRDDVRASPTDAAASLRFGADGRLFVAFDDGGLPGLAGNFASPNGKILRMNPDGTTPADQAAGTPLYSYGHRSPRGLDWHPDAKTLWIADRDSPTSGRITIVAASDGPWIRGAARATLALPRGIVPSSLAFYRGSTIAAFRGNVFVASAEGRQLLRIRLAPGDETRILASEPLLQDRIGAIRSVAIGPDGAIYIGTADAIGRLAPADR
jgi:glucose/arabinose dehydrogenase